MALLELTMTSGVVFAQESDSLTQLLQKETNDSVKFSLMIQIGKNALMANREKAKEYAEKALSFSQGKKMKTEEATAWRLKGTICYYENQYYKAIENYTKSLEMTDKVKDESKTSSQYRNIALCYTKLGNTITAVDYYYKALKIAEKYKDTANISHLFNDIGSVFYQQHNFDNAQSYYFKAYKIYKSKNDEQGMAMILNNIGSVFSESKDYSFALVYYIQAVDLREKVADTLGLISCYTNIGQIYSIRGEHSKALTNDLKALKLAEGIKYNVAIANVYSSLAVTYQNMKNYPMALEYANKGLDLIKGMNDLEKSRDIYKILYEVYDASNKPGLAIPNYKKFLLYRDSIDDQNNSRKASQLQMAYEFDKKQLADSIQTVEQFKIDEEKHQQEISEQKTYTYGGIIGFLLMIIFSSVSFRAYRQKRKDNLLVSEQIDLVEEKQKEILDSIRYAKRIQQSLLPSEKYIENNLNRLK